MANSLMISKHNVFVQTCVCACVRVCARVCVCAYACACVRANVQL